MRAAPQTDWMRVWVLRWKRVMQVRSFAGHELCVTRDLVEGFQLFHRRSGWVLRTRISDAEAVRLAAAWSEFDWDFDDELQEEARATRARVTEWLAADARTTPFLCAGSGE